MTTAVLDRTKTFDAGRAVLQDYLSGYPASLTVSQTASLKDAVFADQIAADAHVLVYQREDRLIAFPMSVVLSYNVIQGEHDQQPWMMTFCNACNTGMVFDPTSDGRRLHFQRRGSYDGLLLIWDEETDSYWQHITGECLYGSSAGKQLNILTTTRHMTAAEVLAQDKNALLITSPLTEEQQALSKMMEKMRAKPERVEAGIIDTIAQEDTRRPRFELGLGLWQGEKSIFYPLVMLHMHNNALLTEFEGRRLLIYNLPDAIAPVAVYADAKRVTWHEDVLHLDSGATIKNHLYYTPDGQAQPLEKPSQLLMRWYGFALTFPGCALPNLG